MKWHNLQSCIIEGKLASSQPSCSKSNVSIVKVCSTEETQLIKEKIGAA